MAHGHGACRAQPGEAQAPVTSSPLPTGAGELVGLRLEGPAPEDAYQLRLQ
jgi:hypothetical protein